MTYLIENFLKHRAVTAINGRPAACQQFVAEEAAFSTASGLPLFCDPSFEVRRAADVVIFTDSPSGEKNIIDKITTWRHARGVSAGQQIKITPIDASAFAKERNFSTALFVELEKRGIIPALIVSTRASTTPQGFNDFELQAELAMAKDAVIKFGCAALLAGHTGPLGHVGDLASKADALWQISVASGAAGRNLTLTQGEALIKLTGRTVGGDGHLPIIILDTVKIKETV